MEPLIIGALAVAALWFVVAPLRSKDPIEEIDPTRELEAKKEVALTAIIDLESERDVGKLSEEDLIELRSFYEAEALDALHRLDSVAHVCSNCGNQTEGGVCSRCGAL
jgi:rubrerythrin